jgi:hypothetical protein
MGSYFFFLCKFTLIIHVAFAFTNSLIFHNQLGYNADKLPLGKLSKSTIRKVSYFDASRITNQV